MAEVKFTEEQLAEIDQLVDNGMARVDAEQAVAIGAGLSDGDVVEVDD